jgi:hypothetical protein
MIKTNSQWTDYQGKIFYVSHVQDGVVFYRNGEYPYCCSIEAFLERFKELV